LVGGFKQVVNAGLFSYIRLAKYRAWDCVHYGLRGLGVGPKVDNDFCPRCAQCEGNCSAESSGRASNDCDLIF
jgi:hypothetical protein